MFILLISILSWWSHFLMIYRQPSCRHIIKNIPQKSFSLWPGAIEYEIPEQSQLPPILHLLDFRFFLKRGQWCNQIIFAKVAHDHEEHILLIYS